MSHSNANTFVPAWLQSPVDELYSIFVDGLKRQCLTDHVTASKHGIVKNRSYIVFYMSKHVFKDMRTTIKELEIGKTQGSHHAIDKCTLYMSLAMMYNRVANVTKVFFAGDDIEEYIKAWETMAMRIGPIVRIGTCILFEGDNLEWL